jgi:hypothetical protein
MGPSVRFSSTVRWEQVEVLEHHADFAADGLDVLEVVGEFGAVDNDLPLLVFFQAVDAADHRGLA